MLAAFYPGPQMQAWVQAVEGSSFPAYSLSATIVLGKVGSNPDTYLNHFDQNGFRVILAFEYFQETKLFRMNWSLIQGVVLLDLLGIGAFDIPAQRSFDSRIQGGEGFLNEAIFSARVTR